MSNPTTSVSASASFLASLGAVAPLYQTSAYSDASAVLRDLQYIGVYKVRSSAPNTDNSNMSAYATLASGGVAFSFALSQSVNIPDFMARLDNFVSQQPGHLVSVEGPNEIWNWPINYNGLTGMAAGVAVQKALYAAVQSDPHVSGTPVLTLTTGGGSREETYNVLGNLSAEANYGNVHIYPQGGDPGPYNYLQANIPWETSVVSPNLPTVITEAGYYTMPDHTYGVNADVQAKYTLDMVLDAFIQGVKTTYLFDLIDQAADPGNSFMDDHFGLFNNDGSPKPAATALHNMTTILADPGGNAATGTGAAYTISNLPSNGHSLELAKTSGADDIVVWAEPVIWNQSSDSEIAVPVSNVTVDLGGTYGSVSVYDPMQRVGATQTLSNVSSVNLALTDHPLIIEFNAASASAAAPAASSATATSSAPAATTPSANDTVVNAGSSAAITDASGALWTITGNGQVAVNGVADNLTSNVIELAYVNGTVWHENTGKTWYSETNGGWSAGTTTSPLPATPAPTGASTATPGVIDVPADEASVNVTVSNTTVTASGGDHAFFISGNTDSFNLSGGTETITDSGSGGNMFNLPAAGNGSAVFNGSVLSNGDVFNLTTALPATDWDGSSGSLSSYLHTTQSGGNTELLVSAHASSKPTGTLLATFNNQTVGLSSILAHATT